MPEWASACTIPSMPSLTVQYNSDSATVELSRDCGEEGTRHMTCRGKEDHDFILNELTCIDEADSMGIGMDNTIKPVTIDVSLSNSHKKSIELMQNVLSDNNEDNSLDVHMNQVEQLPDKYNVEEIMFGDQPIIPESVTTETDAEEIKPTKFTKLLSVAKEKLLKKNSELVRGEVEPGAAAAATPVAVTSGNMDDVMMGDQPALTLEEIVKEDTKELDPKTDKNIFVNPATKESIVVENISEIAVVSEATTAIAQKKAEATTVVAAKPATTFGVPSPISTLAAPTSTLKPDEISTSTLATEAAITSTTSSPMAAIKITKKSFNTMKRTSIENEEVLLLNNKEKKHEDSALTNDHFIPPMLLVRTMFTSNNPHNEHNNETETNIIADTDSTLVPASPISNFVELPTTLESKSDLLSSTTTAQSASMRSSTASPSTSTVAASSTSASSVVATETTAAITATTPSSSTASSSTASVIITESVQPSISSVTVTPITEESTTVHVIHPQPDAPHMRPPHAPKYSNESPQNTVTTSTTIGVTEISTATTTDVKSTFKAIQIGNMTQAIESNLKGKLIASSTIATPIANIVESVATESASNLVTTEKTSTQMATSTTVAPAVEPRTISTVATSDTPTASAPVRNKTAITPLVQAVEIPDAHAQIGETAELTSMDSHAKDFNNSDNFQPYRPNRRRALFHQDTRSYVRKLFG